MIVDLEDAVAVPNKAAARLAAASYLDTGTAWVRINADTLAADLSAIADRPGLAGVVVPKAEPALLSEVDELLGSRDVPVLALLETARGLRDLHAVAESGELHLRPGPDRAELWPIRSAVVVASAAAGLLPPVGPVHTAVRDLPGLARTTELLLRQGFRARTAITPRQLANQRGLHALRGGGGEGTRDRGPAEGGGGVAVDADGRMVDEAVVRSAREVPARSDRLQER